MKHQFSRRVHSQHRMQPRIERTSTRPQSPLREREIAQGVGRRRAGFAFSGVAEKDECLLFRCRLTWTNGRIRKLVSRQSAKVWSQRPLRAWCLTIPDQ
ncbi:uncharacterized protein MYCFIDRAFT_212549 [Pseudocercospora fijiensis CIRAD86]|uniref:Uncharacterized protein n=1 Tax=Pseudocercospora fijiensis (strain CIRAD86) TaxID=383855 RepID=M3AKW3_PSEFD|nr:uncharacterized protein MYCFIDRAFT_212549 [Pseudocercospora fijiensis CIRAD86]EME77763.1 hypothetical protein MYCFIDRAFT_184060 [Pseudocercospora fijiensis CIRAD86]